MRIPFAVGRMKDRFAEIVVMECPTCHHRGPVSTEPRPPQAPSVVPNSRPN